MDILYYQTNKLLLEVQQAFESLERHVGAEAEAIEREIQARIDQATRFVMNDTKNYFVCVRTVCMYVCTV